MLTRCAQSISEKGEDSIDNEIEGLEKKTNYWRKLQWPAVPCNLVFDTAELLFPTKIPQQVLELGLALLGNSWYIWCCQVHFRGLFCNQAFDIVAVFSGNGIPSSSAGKD